MFRAGVSLTGGRAARPSGAAQRFSPIRRARRPPPLRRDRCPAAVFDGTFDPCCVRTAFTSAPKFDFDWHVAACRELVRVSAEEVRLHPLVGPDGKPYPDCAPAAELRAGGVANDVVRWTATSSRGGHHAGVKEARPTKPIMPFKHSLRLPRRLRRERERERGTGTINEHPTAIAATPEPPYYAVIHVETHATDDHGYGVVAQRMVDLGSRWVIGRSAARGRRRHHRQLLARRGGHPRVKRTPSTKGPAHGQRTWYSTITCAWQKWSAPTAT